MGDTKHTKSKVVSSLFWKLMERGGTQGIQFGVQIFLARLLLPEDYGIIALVVVFILLSKVFVQSGFNTALIQKKDADDIDFSSVFYFSVLIAGVLYAMIFFTSPFIADFYRMPLLMPVFRVLAITLFFGAFNSIQNAFVARNMMFRKLFFSSLGAIVLSGIVGISLAYVGWGVWALVAQQLTNQIAICVILWFTVKWRPQLAFSYQRLKELFSFGSKLLASSLLDTFYKNVRSLIIARIYAPAMLGYYNRGEQFPKNMVRNVNGSIQAVMLPAMASHQENLKKVKRMVRRSIVTSSFLMFPLMFGLAAIARPLVILLLTEKWLPAVPFLQIFCVSYALYPIHTANLQAINAIGRSDIFLKLEIIKKVVGIIIILISIPFGVYAIAWGVLLSGILSSLINAYPNSKLLGYNYFEQIKDIIPSLALSFLMGGMVFLVGTLDISIWVMLPSQLAIGAIVYLGLARLLQFESLKYLIVTLKELLVKAKKDVNE